MYSTEQRKLAQYLAKQLQDWHSLGQYLKFTTLYTEAQLRETLARVMAVPEDQIRKSRGALFTHLIQNYDTTEERSWN